MKIFVSRSFPGTALDTLKNSGHEVVVSPFDRPLTAAELLEYATGVDALLSFLTDKIDGEVMDAIGPQLKIISNYAVGFDNIQVRAATERKILVSNTPCDEVNEAVAEHTWALMLSLARRVVEADEVTKKGAYHGWEPGIFLGTSLKGKTLGVIGLGRIGEMVARRAKGFEMKVLYNKRTADPQAESELGVVFSDIPTLLAQSDVVSLHAPLTPETHHLMNTERFSQMKQGSLFINTARGPMVDEYALVTALREGKIAGAGLDVFDAEPDVNPELIGMENVILTPHIASATHEARQKMGELAVAAILATETAPQTLVNPEIWESRRR
jgi:glyoxylate reductase